MTEESSIFAPTSASRIAKILRSRGTGRRCARRAPKGTEIREPQTMSARAGRWISPRWSSFSDETPKSCAAYCKVAAKEIGKPTAADVPIASIMGSPHQERKGTVSDPPPIPTRAETAPIRIPAAVMPTGPGARPDARMLGPWNILVAAAIAKSAKQILRRWEGRWMAIWDPAKVPARIPGVMLRKTSQRTACFRLWMRRLRKEVKEMTAREVATAEWMECGVPEKA